MTHLLEIHISLRHHASKLAAFFRQLATQPNPSHHASLPAIRSNIDHFWNALCFLQIGNLDAVDAELDAIVW